ncbi:hypothetical protein HYU06_01485 [Candidatus Woesearchaeota archaeon]|nr:hypothetical protein [Candidatus Woesearchaeota archaeon]
MELVEMEKPWYMSKGIVGGVLVAVSGILLAAGQLLQGQLDVVTFFSQVIPLVGTGLSLIGIRLAK